MPPPLIEPLAPVGIRRDVARVGTQLLEETAVEKVHVALRVAREGALQVLEIHVHQAVVEEFGRFQSRHVLPPYGHRVYVLAVWVHLPTQFRV